MSKRTNGQARGKYTLEFKLEAVRLVKGGQAVPVTAKILGIPVQTLGNWVRLSEEGQLKGAGDRPVSAKQVALARVRAELARMKDVERVVGPRHAGWQGACQTPDAAPRHPCQVQEKDCRHYGQQA